MVEPVFYAGIHSLCSEERHEYCSDIKLQQSELELFI